MKSLARRIKGALSLGFCTMIGISMTWSIALGQSTPDTAILVPEPATLPLVAGAVALVLLARRRR
jgi:hypothetical protein